MLQEQFKGRDLKSLWFLIKNSVIMSWRNCRSVFNKGEANVYYESLGNDVLGLASKNRDPQEPLWMNMGFWRNARTYPEACAELARLLAEAAQFSPGDLILDVGFGYADQDILWSNEYQFDKIIGINITKSQVEAAKKRISTLGLENKVDLRLGSATNLPFSANTFDKIVAHECAFHFSTREKFFEEAYRVLKPNGRLVTSDLLPLPTTKVNKLVSKFVRRAWRIPEANVYDSLEYVKKLTGLGFKNITCESIRHNVYPGMFKYMKKRLKGENMTKARIELSEEEIKNVKGVAPWRYLGGMEDYVIFTAEKAD